jgi:hypothetical protein
VKKFHLAFFAKLKDLIAQSSNAAAPIQALRLNQKLEFSIGNALLWFQVLLPLINTERLTLRGLY